MCTHLRVLKNEDLRRRLRKRQRALCRRQRTSTLHRPHARPFFTSGQIDSTHSPGDSGGEGGGGADGGGGGKNGGMGGPHSQSASLESCVSSQPIAYSETQVSCSSSHAPLQDRPTAAQ